jgi:hypothetical protein
MELDAHPFQSVHFGIDDGVWQAELGNAVNQHTAGLMQRFEHFDFVAIARAIAGHCQSSRPGAHHGNTLTRGLAHFGDIDQAAGALPVRHEALQAPNRYWFFFLIEDADDLTLRFLGADASADRGQDVSLLHLANATAHIALGQEPDETWDIDANGAACYAQRFLALDTARCLEHGGFH